MDTLTLLQFAAKRNEAAADALHHRISEAGAIARIVGGVSDSYSRFRLHDAVNRVYQSQNGTVTLVVTVKDDYTPKHAVSISTRGQASDPGDWLVAQPPPYSDYSDSDYWLSSHDIPLSPPVYWADGMGTHWEVLLVSPSGDVYFDRRSMTGRARYTLRVVRDAEGYWGVPVPPMDHIDPDWRVVCTDDDGNDSDGEVAAVWENIPITDTEERWFAPEWRIEIAPYDLSALAEEIDNHIMAANTPNTPAMAAEENAENVVEALPDQLFEDDEDESSYLGASTLAKLRDAKLFDDKEDE